MSSARRRRFYWVVRRAAAARICGKMAAMRNGVPKRLRCLAWLAMVVPALPSPAFKPATAAPAAASVAIHAIQGRGARSPLAGRRVVTQGAVTLVTSNGFFVQEQGEGDPRSSRAIFAFTGGVPAVAPGQCVRLAGRVVEFNAGAPGNHETLAHTVTELHEVADLRVLRDGCDVAPVMLALPLPAGDSLERFEGMLVTLRGPLTVQQNFFLGRFGQLTLAAGGRVRVPTNVARPGAAARALARANARRSIVLDDGSALQFPSPVPYLGDDGTVRAGDTADSITGVIDYGLATAGAAGPGAWKIHPLRPPSFARANPRTAAPARNGADLRIAAANIDNFFSTLDDGRHVCAPRQVAADCRGARSAAEFERQRAKIVEMLAAIDADVVALMEIENNGATALQSLVDALNARVGAETWAIIDEAPGVGGTDAIRVALIYKPARVAPVGPARSDRDPAHNRPPLAQTFATADGGAPFNLIASHFKSRRCDGASGIDLDQDDLQACFSGRRVAQARALARFAVAVARTNGVSDTLLVGDFNAYAREDPPVLLAAAGFTDQAARFDPDAYSYVFDGAAGRLDGVFASASLAPRVTGVATWHVNADEPELLDYAFALRAPGGASAAATKGAATPWRASDHDPVVIGLRPGVAVGIGAAFSVLDVLGVVAPGL
jgi:predicted extracellular nuclease